MVIGENRKYPAALIVPDFTFLKQWCELHNINCQTNIDIIGNVKVLERIQQDINDFNKDYGNAEQIKKFSLLENEWTTANGELTATLKLKRKIIAEKYKSAIENIYTEEKVLL